MRIKLNRIALVSACKKIGAYKRLGNAWNNYHQKKAGVLLNFDVDSLTISCYANTGRVISVSVAITGNTGKGELLLERERFSRLIACFDTLHTDNDISVDFTHDEKIEFALGNAKFALGKGFNVDPVFNCHDDDNVTVLTFDPHHARAIQAIVKKNRNIKMIRIIHNQGKVVAMMYDDYYSRRAVVLGKCNDSNLTCIDVQFNVCNYCITPDFNGNQLFIETDRITTHEANKGLIADLFTGAKLAELVVQGDNIRPLINANAKQRYIAITPNNGVVDMVSNDGIVQSLECLGDAPTGEWAIQPSLVKLIISSLQKRDKWSIRIFSKTVFITDRSGNMVAGALLNKAKIDEDIANEANEDSKVAA